MNLFKGDKRKHFGLGFLLSWVSAWIFFVLFGNFATLIAAMVVPFVASLIWEWIHLYKSRFSWDDIFAAMCGAIIATVIWGIILIWSDYIGLLI